ncbi:MAG: hypothetical protein JW884_11935 [Deltaproteobacteria bacterium]|nr:hypothetical protein [Deltaproteobacteria bacterium]
MRKFIILISLTLFFVLSCVPAYKHANDVQEGLQGDRLSVGKVQREIRKGMYSADVIQVLGSPNILSTDDQGREVWVYDKIATDHVYSTSQGGISALILGATTAGTGIVGGGIGPSFSSGSGASSVSQRTLTVIIKFDETGKVRDFAYHSSRF